MPSTSVRESRPPDARPRAGLPLRGVDLILLALDSEQVRGKAGCNNAVLVLELERPLAVSRLESALARLVEHCAWPSARLKRPFPWGRLQWKVRGEPLPPRVERTSVTRLSDEDVLRIAERELDDRIDPRCESPLRFRTVDADGGGRSLLLMTWSRPLMDPHGADALLTHLDHLDRNPGVEPWGGRLPLFEPPPHTLPLRDRGNLGLRSRAFVRSLGKEPPISLGRGRPSMGRARLLRRTVTTNGGTSTRLFRETPFRLAWVARAIAGLHRKYNLPDTPFLVPLAVDMRPKGEIGPVFGNYLTFHFSRFLPTETAEPRALADKLRADMIQALRERMLECHWYGMDFLQYRPIRSILREMSWARGKDPFSFSYADTAEFAPRLDSFLGTPFRNVLHSPAPLPRPGIGVFFTRCRGLENATVAWAEGVISEDDARSILKVVAEGLGWDAR